MASLLILLHAANLRHWTDGFTSPPKEGVLRIFSPLKIRRIRPGLNPRTWVLKASTLPLDYRSSCFFYIRNFLILLVNTEVSEDGSTFIFRVSKYYLAVMKEALRYYEASVTTNDSQHNLAFRKTWTSSSAATLRLNINCLLVAVVQLGLIIESWNRTDYTGVLISP